VEHGKECGAVCVTVVVLDCKVTQVSLVTVELCEVGGAVYVTVVGLNYKLTQVLIVKFELG